MFDRSSIKTDYSPKRYAVKSIEDSMIDPIAQLWAKQEKERKDEADAIRMAEEKNEYSSLPNFNQKIIANALPSIIVEYLDRYEDRNQKDVFLLSLVTHISGILPNYFVIHDGDELTTNLNVFITAPAGSGKSAMTHATKFFYGIDDELTNQANEELMEFEHDGSEKKVVQKTLFIPANTSSAAIIKCLNNNGGRGIICETEADTLSNILTKEWANFDDILRKAFHNEPITMSRAGLDKIVKIPNPALSVILTGTPQQVTRLIPSIENGLFSRFLYYYFTSDSLWRNVFGPNGKIDNLDELNVDISTLVSAMYFDRLNSNKIYFKWTMEQGIELDAFFAELLYESTNIYGAEINSVVYRLGLVASRLGAIIAYFNSYWNNLVVDTFVGSTITADEHVFKLVKHLIKVQLQHSQYIFMQLPRRVDKSFSENTSKQSFLNMLPDKFTRKEAIEIFAFKAFIKTRTADGFLAEFVKNKKLARKYSGDYYKPDKF